MKNGDDAVPIGTRTQLLYKPFAACVHGGLRNHRENVMPRSDSSKPMRSGKVSGSDKKSDGSNSAARRTTTTKKPSAKAANSTASAKSSQASERRPQRSRKESRDALRQRTAAVVELLKQRYPRAECALRHRNAFELLVATILSAQCTDARVNMVTPALFERYPTPADLATSTQEDVEQIIQSTGFFRAKAKNIREMARQLVDRFAGEIPRSLEEMITLPGVGRKTANVVLGTVYGLATGVVVDTHVQRITQLLGLVTVSQPEKIEQVLMDLLPVAEWIEFSHRLIHHGRQICIARRPQCDTCPLLPQCHRVGLELLADAQDSE